MGHRAAGVWGMEAWMSMGGLGSFVCYEVV